MSAFIADIFTYNFSLLTHTFYGYIYVLSMCILIGLVMFLTWRKQNVYKDALIMLICMVIGGSIPYNGENYSVLSSLHVPCCYVCCFIISILQIKRLFYYQAYNKRIGNKLLIVWLFTLLLCILLWFNFMCINTLIEIIYFGVILTIDAFIYYLK